MQKQETNVLNVETNASEWEWEWDSRETNSTAYLVVPLFTAAAAVVGELIKTSRGLGIRNGIYSSCKAIINFTLY